MIEFIPSKAALPFSTAVRVDDVLYLSGQIGIREDGSLSADFTAQARQAMENIRAALATAGSALDDVFKCTIMLQDMARWEEFNAVYLEYFRPDRLPARSAFGCNALALGAQLEVECLAYAG